MIRLLVDENAPRSLVEALRKAGYDEEASGAIGEARM